MNLPRTAGAVATGVLLALQAHATAGSPVSPLQGAGLAFRQPGSSVPACPDASPPLHDLAAIMYYQDVAGSVVDVDRQQENRAAVKPLDDFTHLLLRQSDAFMRTGSASSARCAFDLLHEWAAAGALTGDLGLQGRFHRNWATNAFATAYLIVRDRAGADPEQRRTVQGWLARLCELNQELAERVSNNHLAWCAASCASVGVASGRQDLLDWAVLAAEQVLEQVDEQGMLPREIARGGRALAYHNFTLEALVAAAEMAMPNGADLYAYRGAALRRLAGFVIRNATDPNEAAELAGTPQSWRGATSGRFVWAEPYYRRFGDPRLPPILQALRPMRHAYFGGNATSMYGVALLPDPPVSAVPENGKPAEEHE